MGDPKQVYISAKFCEKNLFSPPGGAERLISRLSGFRKIGSTSFILLDSVKWMPPLDSSWKNTQPWYILIITVFNSTVYSGYNDIARDRKNYVGCRENRYIRSKYKRKTPIGTEENMSDVAEIVIPGVVITGVHCTNFQIPMTYRFRNLVYLLILTKNICFRLVKLPFFTRKVETLKIVLTCVRSHH